MKTINNRDYKTVGEILLETKNQLLYPRTSEQLHSLALTCFALKIEKYGATIL